MEQSMYNIRKMKNNLFYFKTERIRMNTKYHLKSIQTQRNMLKYLN